MSRQSTPSQASHLTPSTATLLLAANAELRVRLEEAEETLRAIRSGEVDALVVDGPAGPQVYTLQGADAESNQFRGEILAQISDAVVAVNNDYRVTYLNAAAERQYAVTGSEALGRSLGELWSDRWLRPEDEAASRTALQETGYWRGENIHTKRNGEEIHVESAVIRLYDANGAPIGLLATIRDVTERKRAEAALRKSEAMTRSIFESSNDCIKVLDLEGRLLAINPSGCSLMEIDDPEALFGSDWVSWWPAGTGHSARFGVEEARSGGSTRFQGFCPTLKGTPRWWDVVVAPICDAEGRPAQIVAISRDITELHHTTEALLNNEQKFRSLAEGMPHFVWETDANGRSVYQNEKWYAYTGLTPQQTRLSGWLDVLHPKDVQRMAAAWAGALETGGELDTQARLLRASDGEYRWFHVKGAPVRDGTNKVTRWVGTCTDIHDQRQTEAALQESELRFRELVHGIGNLAWMAKADGWIFWYNQRWYEYTGTTAEQMEGWGWQSVHDPDHLPHVLEQWQACIATGEPFEMVFPLRGADGKFRQFLTRAMPLRNPDGSIKSWFGTNTDISRQKAAESALRASEQRLRLGTSVAGFALADVDYATGTVRLSPEAAEIFGLPANTAVVARNAVHSLFHPDDRDKVEELLERAADPSGDGLFAMEHRIMRPDGEVRWISVRKQVVFERGEGAPRPVSAVEAILDITARKKAEIALRDAAKRKDEFLAMLGHELRNPLAAIRHAVQIANESLQDFVACEWASEVIDRQSVQLSRMVDDLLDVARINRGRIELRSEKVDLRTVITRATAVVRPLIEKRRHSYNVEIGDGDLFVAGDAARIEQVMVNLLNNAAKYTPEGGRIRLAARVEGTEAAVSVTDNGVGIAAELLPHVFDLFRQADTSLDRAQGGLGIGLTVVKSLIEMHCGRVAVESGGSIEGTMFTVWLPLLTDAGGASDAAEPPLPGALPKGVRVLIVDDHVDAAEALARLLARRNCEVRVAHDGPGGITLAREFRPDVLLLDLGLPGLDGYELARTLRADPTFADALFIAISGYAQDGDRARSLAAGFEHHCAKPVDFASLLAAIRSRSSRA